MRGARSTLVMLVVFLGLGAYVYFVEMERRPASEAPPNEQLFEITADGIDTLSVRAGGDDTSLQRGTDATWAITSPIESGADDTTVSSMTSEIETLEIQRVVDEAPADLAPFGLADPAVEVAFSAAGGEGDHRLLIGDTSPTGVDRYAKVADESRVILVSASLESTFNKTTFDLRDKTILDFESADADQFEIQLEGSSMTFAKSDDEWHLTTPWDVRADFGTVDGLVGRLASGQMLSVATENIDEAAGGDETNPYGLDPPAITATVTAGSASATLTVGTATASGDRYARDASRSIVFTVEPSLLGDLEREAVEYRRKDLFTFRSFNATRLEVERPDATYEFEKTTGDNDVETWTQTQPASLDMERSAMDDLLAKISNLRADTFVESRADQGLSDADIVATVRVTFGDEETEERVVFWRSGDDTYAVHGDEPGAGIVDSRSVDDAFEGLGADSSTDDATP